MHDDCNGCKHDLGGGQCRINLEKECAYGGGYEAWEDAAEDAPGKDADLKKDRYEIYAMAREAFGINNQIVVAIEEMAELQKELCKHLRHEGSFPGLCGEIADVEIMLEQLKDIFDCSLSVNGLKRQKIARLERRIHAAMEKRP